MDKPLSETEPENWYRGVHEAGHAVAIWTLGAAVTRIEVRRTHPDELSPAQCATVSRAGTAAEELFENHDIRGCSDDEDRFTSAIAAIRSAEGEDAAQQVSRDATERARTIVRDQRAAIEALAAPIAGLIHGAGVLGTAEMSREDAEGVARRHWSGPLPRALADR